MKNEPIRAHEWNCTLSLLIPQFLRLRKRKRNLPVWKISGAACVLAWKTVQFLLFCFCMFDSSRNRTPTRRLQSDQPDADSLLLLLRSGDFNLRLVKWGEYCSFIERTRDTLILFVAFNIDLIVCYPWEPTNLLTAFWLGKYMFGQCLLDLYFKVLLLAFRPLKFICYSVENNLVSWQTHEKMLSALLA